MALNPSGGWSRNLGSGRGSSSSSSSGSGNRLRARRNKRRSVRVRAQINCNRGSSDEHCVLGVSPFASRQEIKAAYRRLALQYHPDVCKEDDCEERFKQVNHAYEAILKRQEQIEENDYTRRMHDNDEWEEWQEWMGFECGLPYHFWLGNLSIM